MIDLTRSRLGTLLKFRWTHCPPQGAHTSHLRTLSKIILARAFRLRVSSNISSERADYYTTNFLSVNTFFRKFFFRILVSPFVGLLPSAAAIEGGRIIHPILDSSTPLLCVYAETSLSTTSRAHDEAPGWAAVMLPRGARARNCACPAAADVLRPARALVRDRSLRHRRYAQRARQACAAPRMCWARARRL